MREEFIFSHGPWTHISTIRYKNFNVIIYRNNQGFINTVILTHDKKLLGIKLMRPLIVSSGDILSFLKQLSQKGIESTLISKSEPGLFFVFLILSVGPRYIELPILSEKELNDPDKLEKLRRIDEQILKMFEEVYQECENLSKKVIIDALKEKVRLETIDHTKINVDTYMKKLLEDSTFTDFLVYNIEPGAEVQKIEKPKPKPKKFKTLFEFPEKYKDAELLPVGKTRRDEIITFEVQEFRNGINLLLGKQSETDALTKVLAENFVGIGYTPILFAFDNNYYTLFTERSESDEKRKELAEYDLNILSAPNVINLDPFDKRGLPLKLNVSCIHTEILLELLGIDVQEYKFIVRDAVVLCKDNIERIPNFDKFIEMMLYYMDIKGWKKKIGFFKFYEIENILKMIKKSYLGSLLIFDRVLFSPLEGCINIVDLTSPILTKQEKTALAASVINQLLYNDRDDIVIFLNYDELIFLDDFIRTRFEKLLKELSEKNKIIFLSSQNKVNLSVFLRKQVSFNIDLISESEAAFKKNNLAIRFRLRPTITSEKIPSDDIIKNLSYRIGGAHV